MCSSDLAALRPAGRPGIDVVVLAFLVTTASFLASALAVQIAGLAALRLGGEAAMIVNGAGAQLGMLAGAALFRLRVERVPFLRNPLPAGVLRDGFATFLISLPVVVVAGSIWEQLLRWLGLPVHKQDLVAMFANASSDRKSTRLNSSH